MVIKIVKNLITIIKHLKGGGREVPLYVYASKLSTIENLKKIANKGVNFFYVNVYELMSIIE